MALTGFTTDYADLNQLPAYQPAFITIATNATACEVVRMQVREKPHPSGGYSVVSQMTRQADLNSTSDFTFNLCAIAQDRLSAADDPLLYGYPNGVTFNEWKQYQFVYDELSRNASDQLVVTDNDKGWDGATGVVEEGYGTLGIHYASWHDQGNQYYLSNLTNNLVDLTSYAWANNALPTHTGAASSGRFLTDLTGITISEPWSFTLDYVVGSDVTANFKLAYRHTLSAVVYDREVTGLTLPTDSVERQRVQVGFKDLEDNSNFSIAWQVLQSFDAGDDDGAEILLKYGATAMTSPRWKMKLINADGCRKVGLEWVNPYGAVDFMEFRMKGDDFFIQEQGEEWERSDYESFSTVYGSSEKYPQQLRKQNSGRYSLELQSHPLPKDYGHLVLKQLAVSPKAWIQIQMGAGGFTRNDESFTQSNITDRIPVTLQVDEESILIDRKDKGHITINLRANFSRRQVGQRT